MRMFFYDDKIMTQRLQTVVLVGFVCVFLLAGKSGHAATLENPARGAVVSGLGFISGWKCNARRITVRINDGPALPVAMRQSRADTRSACGGATNNGFIAQMNWMILGDGTHQITAYDDGVQFASATFDVVTTGVEFLKGVTGSGTATLSNGQRATLEWSEASQSFVATEYTDPSGGGTPTPPPPPDTTSGVGQFVGTWRFTNSHTTQTYRFPRVEQCEGEPCVIDRAQIAILGLGEIAGYSYLLLHQDSGTCRSYLFYEPIGGSVRGHYGYGIGSCTSDSVINAMATHIALERYPTTGARVSRSAAQPLRMEDTTPLSADMREDQEAISVAIDNLIDALGTLDD